MLAALDNGSLDCYVLSYSAEEDDAASFHFLERTNTVSEHDDVITGMCAAGPDGASVVTASHDRAVVVMDANTMAKTREVMKSVRWCCV